MRNVFVLSLAFFLLKGGEQLWERFLPAYMHHLGASILMIGLFGALKELLDAVYQYPGGALADRIGSQRLLLLANALALAGYGVYWIAPRAGWPVLFLGLFLVMAWETFSLPATFSLIAQSLPVGKRTTGFSIQATLKRLPVAVAPPIGGWLIGRCGDVGGVRSGLLVSIAVGSVALLAQHQLYEHIEPIRATATSMLSRFRRFSPQLRTLLVADIFARISEGMSEIFLVLYLINIMGHSAFKFGTLLTIETLVAILFYFPGAWLSNRFGRFPVVLATFGFFALFPLVVAIGHSYSLAVAAFIIAGLREIGEPARKGLITDLGENAGDYGLYYLLRGLTVAPAALAGGWLWQKNPVLPFVVASIFGTLGTVYYLVKVRGTNPATV